MTEASPSMSSSSSVTPKLSGTQEKRNKPQALAFWQSRTRKDSSSSGQPVDAEKSLAVPRGRGTASSSFSRISAALKQGASSSPTSSSASSSAAAAKRDRSVSSSNSGKTGSEKRDASVSSSFRNRNRAGSTSTVATSGSVPAPPVPIYDENDEAEDANTQGRDVTRLARRGGGPKIVGLEEELEEKERRSLENKQKTMYARATSVDELRPDSQDPSGAGSSSEVGFTDLSSRLELPFEHASLYPDMASSSGASSSSKRSSRTSEMLSKSSSSRGNSPWNQQSEWTAGESSTSGQSISGPEMGSREDATMKTERGRGKGYVQDFPDQTGDGKRLSGLGISDLGSMGLMPEAEPIDRHLDLRRRAKSLTRPKSLTANARRASKDATMEEEDTITGQEEGHTKDHLARERRRRKLLRVQMRKRQARRRGNTISTSRAEAELGPMPWLSDDEDDDDDDDDERNEDEEVRRGQLIEGWGSDDSESSSRGPKYSDQKSSLMPAKESPSFRRRSLGGPSTSATSGGRQPSIELTTYGSPPESMRSFSSLSHDGSEAFFDAGAGSSPESNTVSGSLLSSTRRRSVDNRQSPSSSSFDGSSWLHLTSRPSATASSTTLRQDAVDRERRLENKESSATLSPRHGISAGQSPPLDKDERAAEIPTRAEEAAGRKRSGTGTKRETTLLTNLPALASSSASSPQEPELASPTASSQYDGSFVPDFSSPTLGTPAKMSSRSKRTSILPPARPMPHSPPPPPPTSRSQIGSISASPTRRVFSIERGEVQPGQEEAGDRTEVEGRLRSGRRSGKMRDRGESVSAADMIRTESEASHGQRRPSGSATVGGSSSSLGPSGTIRGRPRGATVGAVPGNLDQPKHSQRLQVPLQRARPRSMLCNEMVLPSEQPSLPSTASMHGGAAIQSEREDTDEDDLIFSDNMNMSGDYISPADAILSSMMRSGDVAGMDDWSQSMSRAWSAESSSGHQNRGRAARRTDGSSRTSPRSLSDSSGRGSGVTSSMSNFSTSSTGAAAASVQAQIGDSGNSTHAGIVPGGSSSNSSSYSSGNLPAGTSGSGGGAALPPPTTGTSSAGNRSRSGSTASLLQQMQYPPKSHACFVIGVVGHRGAGKSTVIKKGLRQYGLFKSNSFSEKVKSHSTMCVVDQEQRSIEVIEIDASLLLNGPNKRFAWPKFLPRLDAVCLCYDAAQLPSFRGISELLENFSVCSLSTVMLACKSDIEPKAVDPWYASDMAAVYNVGLAECSVNTEEGKRRMRDCFSYLVKDVVKVRARKGLAFDGSLPASSTSSQRNGATSSGSSQVVQDATSTNTTAATTTTMTTTLPTDTRASSLDGAEALSASTNALISAEVPASQDSARGDGSHHGHDGIQHERSRAIRKMSDATTASTFSADDPSLLGSASEDDRHMIEQSINRAQMGLQSAKSAGGYVSIEELWDKLFFAAVSGEDPKFLFKFMIFYRGFARPSDLLKQLVSRFGKLAESERHDGTIIRFSMMRLTTMLADWMRDYPGDLSGSETFPMLKSLFDDFLLVNETTRHLAVQLEPLLDMVRNAPDLDAVWSKNQDNHKPQSVAADVPPVKPAPVLESSDGSLNHVERDQSAASVPSSAPSSGHHQIADGAIRGRLGSNAGSDTRSRAYSDTSSARGATPSSVDGSLLHARQAGPETRHRSASDVTAASSEGVESGLSGGRSASINTSASNSFVDDGSSIRARSGSGVNETIFDAATNTSAQASPSASVIRPRLSQSGTTSGSGSESVLGGGGGGGAGSGSSSAATMSNATGVVSSSGGGTTGKAESSPSSSMTGSAMLPSDQKSKLRAASNALFDVEDEAIAQELTRLEWTLFGAIRPRDLLRHILVDRSVREKDAPVARSIAHFNYVSYWVCSMILVQAKLKPRARLLEKFMNIAVLLRHANNYNTLQAVLAGLGNAAVHRLKNTRELLNGKPVNKAYQSLARLMGSDRSFAAYRLALQNSEGQTIPYLGVHLQDILSISDGNPSKRASDAMIHWRKFTLMDDAVGAIVKCQEYDYPPAAASSSTSAHTGKKTSSTPNVIRLVDGLPVWDEEALYSRSLQVEPRQGNGPSAVGALANSRIIRSFFAD